MAQLTSHIKNNYGFGLQYVVSSHGEIFLSSCNNAGYYLVNTEKVLEFDFIKL